MKKNPFTHANGTLASVYLTGDLIKNGHSWLAYQAGQLKREGKFSDTWVYGTRMYVKDNHSHVSQINIGTEFQKSEN